MTSDKTEAAVDPLANIHLPVPENKSQAIRLARLLFGPLVRIDEVEPGVWAVATERNRLRKRIAFGPDFHTVIRKAVLELMECKNPAEKFPDVIQPRQGRNTVEDKRRNLVIKLPDVATDVVGSLHPHEVLDMTDLMQVRAADRDQKSINFYLAGANRRLEIRKKEMARLKAIADAAKAAIEAAAKEA